MKIVSGPNGYAIITLALLAYLSFSGDLIAYVLATLIALWLVYRKRA